MKQCPKCGERHNRQTRGRLQSYCRRCHAAYMRATRPKHSELDPEARRRSSCRAYTNQLVARGVLVRGPCAECGEAKAQAHHPDYSDPRTVVWLCRPCHLRLHREANLDAAIDVLGRFVSPSPSPPRD